MTPATQQQIQKIDAEIAAQRDGHRRLNDAIFTATKEQETAQIKIDFLLASKEVVRREMNRLHKQKFRLVSGRN